MHGSDSQAGQSRLVTVDASPAKSVMRPGFFRPHWIRRLLEAALIGAGTFGIGFFGLLTIGFEVGASALVACLIGLFFFCCSVE